MGFGGIVRHLVLTIFEIPKQYWNFFLLEECFIKLAWNNWKDEEYRNGRYCCKCHTMLFSGAPHPHTSYSYSTLGNATGSHRAPDLPQYFLCLFLYEQGFKPSFHNVELEELGLRSSSANLFSA